MRSGFRSTRNPYEIIGGENIVECNLPVSLVFPFFSVLYLVCFRSEMMKICIDLVRKCQNSPMACQWPLAYKASAGNPVSSQCRQCAVFTPIVGLRLEPT